MRPIIQGLFGVFDDLYIYQQRLEKKVIEFNNNIDDLSDSKVLIHLYKEELDDSIMYMKDFRANLTSEIGTINPKFEYHTEEKLARMRFESSHDEATKIYKTAT